MFCYTLLQVTEIDVPNSLIEEQGRIMYAGKLLEIQVFSCVFFAISFFVQQFGYQIFTKHNEQARMNMSTEQLANLSSEQMVNNYLISQKQSIVDAVKQVLAVAEIFKSENLTVRPFCAVLKVYL